MEDNRTTVVFNLDRNLSKYGQRSQNILLQASLKNKSLSVRIQDSETMSSRSKSFSACMPRSSEIVSSHSKSSSVCMPRSSENVSSRFNDNRHFVMRQSFSTEGVAQPTAGEDLQSNSKTVLMKKISNDSNGSRNYSVFSSCDSCDSGFKGSEYSNSCSDELEKCKVVKINLQQDYLEVLKNLRETDLSEKDAEGAETEIVFHKVPAEAVERMRRLTNELNQRR